MQRPLISIWITCPIGVSSLIGRSFILEEAALKVRKILHVIHVTDTEPTSIWTETILED